MTQPRTLLEQLKALEHLQELDLKIDSIRKTRSSVPAALKTVDDSIAKTKTTVQSKTNAVEELGKVQRQTQAALDLNRDRLTRSTARLETVQNSQEFQAIQKELEQLRKLTGNLEEQSKKSITDQEHLGKEITDLKAQLEKLGADRTEQAAAFEGETGKMDSELSKLTGERATYTPKVEARTLALYDRVRGARAGMGIAPAVGGRCKGCNMMVPPQLFNEIQRGSQLHSCPSCHRILFVPSATPQAT